MSKIFAKPEHCFSCSSYNVMSRYNTKSNEYYVYCLDCKCRGPVSYDPKTAVEKWNNVIR